MLATTLLQKTDTRLRTNNGKTRDQYTRSDYGREADSYAQNYSNMRVKSERDRNYKHTYDETDEEFMDYQKEMFEMVPDTAQMLEQLLAEREARRRRCSDAISLTMRSLPSSRT